MKWFLDVLLGHILINVIIFLLPPNMYYVKFILNNSDYATKKHFLYDLRFLKEWIRSHIAYSTIRSFIKIIPNLLAFPKPHWCFILSWCTFTYVVL